ncbi:MAG: synthase delta subunit [Chloroflexi bacterium]|nr:synthase delta subunit [Chloroflexota bacterium]
MPVRAGSARRYADALFSIAAERGTEDAWGGELDSLAAVVQHPAALSALAGPDLSLEQKGRIINAAAGPLSREVRSLADILLQRKRIGLAPQLAEEFHRRIRQQRGIELADVISAVPLAIDEKRIVEERLAHYLGRTVEIRMRTDPAIIGGIVARVGDQLIDASVRGRLESLRKRLKAGE